MMKGAIFDLDGTLVYSVGLHAEAWKKLFLTQEITLTDEELREQSGMKNLTFIKNVLERRGISGLDQTSLSEQKDEMVLTLLKTKPASVFPGARQLLELLRSKCIKLALATSASRETALILGKEVIGFFDYLIFSGDVTRGKPDPEIFLKAAEGLGLTSNECIVFEDAESGVEAAKRGGFFCIAKDNGPGQDLSKADQIIDSYEPDMLIKLFCET